MAMKVAGKFAMKAMAMKVAKPKAMKAAKPKKIVKKKPGARDTSDSEDEKKANVGLEIVKVDSFDLDNLSESEDAPSGVPDTRGMTRSQRWIWDTQFDYLTDDEKAQWKLCKTMSEKNIFRNACKTNKNE